MLSSFEDSALSLDSYPSYSLIQSTEDHGVPMTELEEGTSGVPSVGDSSKAIIDEAVQELSRYEEFISPRRSILEARKSEKELYVSTKLVQSRHKWIDEKLLQKPVYSPTNSIGSQCTALSRARSAIEGRRKSRAAAKARASAVMNELQNSKNVAREAAKERAWDALAEIQRSRSFSSRGGGIGSMRRASHEEHDERRQPITSKGSTSQVHVEESREEAEEDRAGEVITEEKPENSEICHHDKLKTDRPTDADEAKKEHRKEEKKKCKRTRDRKSRSIANKNLTEYELQRYSRNGSKTSSATSRNEPNSNFVLSEEALMAVSRAALEVAPKIDTLQLPQRRDDNKTTKSMRDCDSSSNVEEYPKDIDGNGLAHTKAGRRTSTTASEKTVRSSPKSMFTHTHEARTVVSQAVFDVTSNIAGLRPLRKEPRYIEGVAGAVEELRALKDVLPLHQVAATSNNSYIATMSRNNADSFASAKNSTMSTNQKTSFLALSIKNDSNHHRNMPPIDLAKSEASYDEPLSSSSSSNNGQKDIKPIETEDSIGEGALDKMMYQGKSLEAKNHSEDSAHSSYSSDHSHMSSPDKSMGLIWEKAIDDANKARSPRPMPPLKSETATEGLIQAATVEPLADDETVCNARTGFHPERMKCVAIFGVLFLVMNSLFVTLDTSSIAIRAFGLVGLVSSTFPLMVMWAFVLSSKTQHSFWTWSVKMLLFGCFCQGCTLILFILGSDLGAWAWASGIISLSWLLLLTVEMNTNSPVLPPSVSGKSESSKANNGGVMKCLGLFGLSPGAEQEQSESKSRRISRRKKKNSRLLDGGVKTVDRNQHCQAEYTPPDIV
ncbi:hypothetical protein HJC23_004932 [Cyclotella cryptica]|uniref:Vesicle transport protein n=1 Tax=Cyclotella cryptica TaxID=29204 RepID=A0ABD3PXT4_9STRA|eukprot:CCRYP_011883-RA/>CCRYP_011883-RA protein AED:0.12 eAED:0.12 QI:165/1/1/1/0.5/0.33/3/2365/835